MSWALVIAVAAFLIGSGKFIDDFYPESTGTIKGRLQTLLVRLFLKLERVKIPDLPMTISRFVFSADHRLTLKRIAVMSVIYFIIVFIIYCVLTYTVASINIRSVPLMAFVASCFATPIFMCISLPFGRLGIKLIRRTNLAIQRFLTPIFLIGITVIITVLTFVIVETLSWEMHGKFVPYIMDLHNYNVVIAAIGIFIMMTIPGALIEPTIPILIVAALSGILLAYLFLVRIILMAIFEKASDPKKSPFAYFFSLFGVGLLVIKLMQEIFK